MFAGCKGRDAAEVDDAGDAILEQRDTAGALRGSGFKQVAAGGDVEDVGDGNADMSISFAADDDDDFGFGVGKIAGGGGGEDPARVLDRHQLALEVEHGPVSDVLNARKRNLLNAEHVGEGYSGAAAGGLDEQVLHALDRIQFLLISGRTLAS